MTRNVYNKNIRRTIFGSLGRYIAIMAIIALGVGFFAGVKNTKGSMMETLDKYVQDQNMYDYRLISTYGFTEDDEKALQKVDAVAEAEGSVTADFFSQDRRQFHYFKSSFHDSGYQSAETGKGPPAGG